MNKSFDRKLAQCAAYILAEGTEWSEGMRDLFIAAANHYLDDPVRDKLLELLRGEILYGLRNWWFDAYEWIDIKDMREYYWKHAEKEKAAKPSWHRTQTDWYNAIMIDRVKEWRW